jgi:hypothetical protein
MILILVAEHREQEAALRRALIKSRAGVASPE